MLYVQKLRAVFATAAVLVMTGAHAQSPTDEAQKQVSNLLSSAINSRVAAKLQTQDRQDDVAWGGLTHLNVKVAGISAGSNLAMAGYDRQVSDKLIVGASLNTFNLVRMNSLDYFNSDFRANGLSLYGAYLINQNFFLVADYSRTDAKLNAGGDLKMGVDSFTLSANGQMNFDKISLRGRLGYVYTDMSIRTGGTRTNIDADGYRADGEVGYNFTPEVRGFVGLQYNTAAKANSDIVLARIGLEHQLAKNASIQGKYERMVYDNVVIPGLMIESFSINGRLSF